MFRYLKRLMDWSEYDWASVLSRIRKARQVWGRFGKLLQREGADPEVLANFYRAVVQALLLYGAETWVILEPMKKKLEGVHTGFLRQVTGKRQIGRGTGCGGR